MFLSCICNWISVEVSPSRFEYGKETGVSSVSGCSMKPGLSSPPNRYCSVAEPILDESLTAEIEADTDVGEAARIPFSFITEVVCPTGAPDVTFADDISIHP